MDSLTFTPISRRNSLTMLFGGLLLVAISLLMYAFGITPILGFSTGLVGMVITILGVLKRLDPPISLKLTPEGLHYYHRKGTWFVPWEAMQRLDQPRHTESMEPLNFVGVRLRHNETHFHSIQPRLALALLMEQRPLQRLVSPCQDGSCLPTMTEHHSGLTGVLAAYAGHVTLLRQGLGFDLYLPMSMLDRTPEAMVTLLRRYRDAALVGSTTETGR
ncbi:DUF2982 domain-containing protein [Ferrimonas gelatinilytica]|uniref:DUF2982 domain-containing protein n=1 Tax=Ferrimonas gelatinilytica TaxID=1255257 RepID=A0ABP9RSI9_9GAMM